MKIAKIRDPRSFSPPCTTFVMLLEAEADKAFMAELTDMIEAARLTDAIKSKPQDWPSDPDEIRKLALKSITPRIQVCSFDQMLGAQIDDPDAYVKLSADLADAALTIEGCKGKAFVVRCFWW